MSEVKPMVQIPLDLLEKLIENNNLFLFQSRWMQGKTEKNAAEYASIEAVFVEAEKCKESRAQVMYHRELMRDVPAANYDGLLKHARALQSINKSHEEYRAFSRLKIDELSALVASLQDGRFESELEANQALTNEVEKLRGALNNLRAHAMDMGNDVQCPEEIIGWGFTTWDEPDFK